MSRIPIFQRLITSELCLYLEAGASLNANTNKSITFNGSVVSTAPATQLVLNNDDTIKGGTYVFNNNVTSGTLSAYNGAKVKLGSYTQANASVSHGKLSWNSTRRFALR